MTFWKELKRRNVYKVGVAYAIVAWLMVQAAAIVFPHLNLPSWAVTLVIVILIIGFPLALLLAWAYEVTPEGIKLTKEVPLAKSITHLTGKKLNYILAGLLVIAIAYIVIDKYFIGRSAIEAEVVSTETDQVSVVADVEEAPKTIAVLSFDDLSPEKDQEYFVLGLSEEILNYLSKISGLHVTSKTSSFTFKDSDKTIQEIAGILGVAHILEGSVRKAGNALRITAQLIQVADDRHLWSKTYDRELKDIFDLQEDIATSIANELKVTLGIGTSFKQLGGTENVEAYELYLVALGQDEGTYTSSLNALESIDAALALDPEYALAWALKANLHGNLSNATPEKRAATERDDSLKAAMKAINIEPDLSEVYYSLGFMNLSKGDFFKAENAYHKAFELDTGGLTGTDHLIGIFYDAVGYFKRASEIFKKIKQNDPLHKAARGRYILSCTFLGDSKRAEEEYEHGLSLFDGEWDMGDACITNTRLGAGKALSRNDIVYKSKVFDMAKEYLDTPDKGLSELRRLFSNDSNLSSGAFNQISMVAAYFGDPEFAMDAVEKGYELEGTGLFFVWLPVMHEVRKLPRFKDFIKEIGLVDYWNEFGWPDICHQLDNSDFECD